jgi:hypothetical protein
MKLRMVINVKYSFRVFNDVPYFAIKLFKSTDYNSVEAVAVKLNNMCPYRVRRGV